MNNSEGAKPAINTVLDETTLVYDVITGTDVFSIAGSDLAPDATKTVAPYLGNYIAKETLALAAFASTIGAKCGLPAIQVIAILDGTNLFLIDGDSFTVDYVDGESATHTLDLTSAATPSADGASLEVATANKFVGATPNQNVTFTLVSHGGQAGTRAQTTTITACLV